jgi:hypothetical protein
MARKKSASTPRDTMAATVLTRQEYEALRAAAEEQDTTVSRLIRRTLIACGVIVAQQRQIAHTM